MSHSIVETTNWQELVWKMVEILCHPQEKRQVYRMLHPFLYLTFFSILSNPLLFPSLLSLLSPLSSLLSHPLLFPSLLSYPIIFYPPLLSYPLLTIRYMLLVSCILSKAWTHACMQMYCLHASWIVMVELYSEYHTPASYKCLIFCLCGHSHTIGVVLPSSTS